MSASLPATDPSPPATAVALPPADSATKAVSWRAAYLDYADSWLHSLALVVDDASYVPWFRRGYRDSISTIRRARGISSRANSALADSLTRWSRAHPEVVTNAHFLPTAFTDFRHMARVVKLAHEANGSLAGDQYVQGRLIHLYSLFPDTASRAWLNSFVDVMWSEDTVFYRKYLREKPEDRYALGMYVDSLWQERWQPRFAPLLARDFGKEGAIVLSMPIGGEGRAVGKDFSAPFAQIFTPRPRSRSEVPMVLYVVAHELVGTIVPRAIEQAVPAETGDRLAQIAAVVGGELLLERTFPEAVAGYRRFYLQQVGAPVGKDEVAQFAKTFAIPDPLRAAILSELNSALKGAP